MLKNKQILLIGTGNMAVPIYQSLLRCQQIKPENVTLICGTTHGRDIAAVERNLTGENIPHAGLHCICRDDVEAIGKLAPADIVIFCAKPQMLDAVFDQFQHVLKDGTILLTIAAGALVEQYKQATSKKIEIIRTMPHLPKQVYGIYAEKEALIPNITPMLEGMGEAIPLASEEDFHAFIAHAGSSPAFIAQFLLRSAECDSKQTLKRLAQDEESPSITSQTGRFYLNWQKAAKADLGAQGKQIVDKTILGTLQYLQQSGTLPETFIAQVRSAKGTTNAGLLYMGNPVPAEERFGTGNEREQQNSLAFDCGKNLAVEDAIIAATRATAARSKGLATEGANPLGGIDHTAVIDSIYS